MRYYYQDNYTTLYHADARDAAEAIPPVALLLTDLPSYGHHFASNGVPGRKLRPVRTDGIRHSLRAGSRKQKRSRGSAFGV